MSALREGRRAWWLRAGLDAARVAVVVGALAAAVAWLLAARGVEVAQLRYVVAVAVAVGLVLALVASALLAPSLLDIARRVDHDLGQAERFSTAYEVMRAGGPTGAPARALVEDVEKRAERVPVRDAVWRRGYRGLGPASAIAALVLVTASVVPVPIAPVAGAARTDLTATLPALPVDAETVSTVAELLETVAEQEDSEYLRALAGAFQELARQVGSGSVSAAEAAVVAQELTDHLRAAASEVGGAFERAVEQALSAATRPTSPAHPAGSPPRVAGEPSAASAGASAPVGGSVDPQRALEALAQRFEAEPASVGVRPQSRGRAAEDAEASFYGGVLNAQADPNAAGPEQGALAAAQAPGGAAAAGAAERSSEAAGDAAGAGVSELADAGSDLPELPAGDGELTLLDRASAEGGPTVEVELVPLPDLAGSGRASTPASRETDFDRTEEAPFRARGVTAERASVVSRYFTPGSQPGP